MHGVALGHPVEGLDEHGTKVGGLVVQKFNLRPEILHFHWNKLGRFKVSIKYHGQANKMFYKFWFKPREK